MLTTFSDLSSERRAASVAFVDVLNGNGTAVPEI
jgi:hypothetical protein